jgi:hypothetical protein
LASLDRERDSIQAHLDDEIEAEKKRVATLRQYAARADEVTSHLTQREKQIALIRKEMEGERRKGEMNAERLRVTMEECAELKRRLQSKHHEVGY